MKRFLAAAMAAFAISAFGDLQIDFTRDAEQMTLQNHTIKQNGKLRTRVWHWSPKDKNYKPMNHRRFAVHQRPEWRIRNLCC